MHAMIKSSALRRKTAAVLQWKTVNKWAWILLRFIIIFGIAFMIVYPVFIKFITALKSSNDMYDPTVMFIPKEPTLNNFLVVIKSVNYLRTLLDTLGLTLVISLLQTVSCTLVAYGFARFDFPCKKLLFGLVIFTLVIPTQAILLPLYIKFQFFNPLQFFNFSNLTGVSIIDTPLPFVLLSVFAVAFKNGLYIYLLRQFFMNLPVTLEEAANIDGCGHFQTFTRIMVPNAVPMLVTVFLFSFVWQWNDYYYTSVLAPNLPVLSVKLMGINFDTLGVLGSSLMDSILQSPKFLLLIAPLVVLYCFTQRFFTESISRSGIVG
jgi:multiple sugar transport system permease protein